MREIGKVVAKLDKFRARDGADHLHRLGIVIRVGVQFSAGGCTYLWKRKRETKRAAVHSSSYIREFRGSAGEVLHDQATVRPHTRP